MKNSKGLSKRIFQARADAGLSQKDFGEEIGVTGKYIAMLERGTKNASEGLLLAMCYRFKVNEGWLKTGNKKQSNGSRKVMPRSPL